MKKLFFIFLFLTIFYNCFCQINYSLTWQNSLTWNIKPTNSEATNTTNATAAINYLIARGGGTLYFPRSDSAYKIKIAIPYVTLHGKWIPIRILGATPPAHVFGTVSSFPIDTSGVILTSAASSGSIISVTDSSTFFSNVVLYLENLEVRATPNPQVNGVDAGFAEQIFGLNVFINSGIYNVQAILPTHSTTGLITPKLSNGAFNSLRNITISGFSTGIEANEHTSGTDINVASCYWAVRCKLGFHTMGFTRLGLYNNHYNFVGDGGNSILKIDNANIEHSALTDSVAWQNTVKDVDDSLNYIHGIMFYSPTEAGSGTHTTFTRNGGSNFNTYAINDSSNFLKLIGNNTFTSVTNQEQFIAWQKNGVNKWKLTQDINGNGNASLTLYDYVHSAPRMIFDSSGAVYIGGNISSPSAAAIQGLTTGFAYIPSRLGINQASPSYPLDIVTSTSTPCIYITNSVAGYGATIRMQNNGASIGVFGKLGSSGAFSSIGNNDMFLENTTSGNITIQNDVAGVGLTGGGASVSGFKVNTNNTSTFATSVQYPYVAKTGTYTATASDYTIDCTSGTFTVTLPTAIGIQGRIYKIKNSGSGTITIATTSSQTIDGVTTKTLSVQYGGLELQSNNANWIVLGSF
jgi:hypothetical protein